MRVLFSAYPPESYKSGRSYLTVQVRFRTVIIPTPVGAVWRGTACLLSASCSPRTRRKNTKRPIVSRRPSQISRGLIMRVLFSAYPLESYRAVDRILPSRDGSAG